MEEINLLEVVDYFKSKLVWIVASVIGLLLIGNIYTLVTRVPMYQSNTTILLASEQTTQSDLAMNTSLVGTYSEIIKSRRVLNQVIKNLDLKYTAGELANRVSLENKEGTQIIVVTVSDSNAKAAKNIANELSKVFSKEIKDIYHLDNVTIIDTAVKSSTPYNLTYTKDNLMYIVIGLVLSCGVVFVTYYFDTTIKSTEDVEDKLGLTIISVVPEERKER